LRLPFPFPIHLLLFLFLFLRHRRLQVFETSNELPVFNLFVNSRALSSQLTARDGKELERGGRDGKQN